MPAPAKHSRATSIEFPPHLHRQPWQPSWICNSGDEKRTIHAPAASTNLHHRAFVAGEGGAAAVIAPAQPRKEGGRSSKP